MKIKIIAVLVVVVGLLGFWLLSQTKDSNEVVPDQKDNANVQDNSKPQDTVVEEVPNALEGELKKSTDPKRGNLMILLNNSDRIIYLNTSRDFSGLIGKQVIATIDGSLDDFRLVDIKAK